MNKIKQFALLFAIIMPACFAQTPNMSQAQLLSLMNAPTPYDLVVLDVRSAEEYAQGHIKGAINISHNNMAEQYHKLSQFKDKTLVVYCRSGRRAGIAEAILAEKGFTRIRHLSGDMKAWQAEGLPLVTE
ncbi:rhodanese-like domain-containing protein [Thalassotalea sp. PLHSN55]|uniref:rhodanese-like domain-containing protein n=1 Tax=Thalassotalea sp. PLHSN55 TaxID=3435888 RepID=UPI003F849977